MRRNGNRTDTIAVMKTFAITMLLAACARAADPFTIETNLVYGMYSGSALLLDIYKPVRPNGFGVIYVSGSGWTAPSSSLR